VATSPAIETPASQTDPAIDSTLETGGVDVGDAGGTADGAESDPQDPFAALVNEADVAAAIKVSPALKNFMAVQAGNAVSERERELRVTADQEARIALQRRAGSRDSTRNNLAGLVERLEGRSISDLSPQEMEAFNVLDDANRVSNTADTLIAIQAAGLKRSGATDAMIAAFKNQVEGQDFTEAGRLRSLAESTERMFDEGIAASIAGAKVEDFMETLPEGAPFRTSIRAYAQELASKELVARGIEPSGDTAPPTGGVPAGGPPKHLTAASLKNMTEQQVTDTVAQSADNEKGWARVSAVASGKPDPGA
jgi:hypothetical protein